MTDVRAPETTLAPGPGLFARLFGVVASPRATYAQIVANPRSLGALAVTIVLTAAIQFAFLSTPVGQDALLERQVRGMESFGMTVSDEMFTQMEARLSSAPYTTAASQIVFVPLVTALVAGILLGLFNVLLDGRASFKQVYAIMAHAGVIVVLQQLFSTPINYAKGEMASPASLAVFVPGLDPEGFIAGFLGAVDLFLIWWAVSLAIGLAVLYKRRTGPIATSLIVVYLGIAAVVALIF